MLQQLDGSSVVILRHSRGWLRDRFEVVASGRMRYDGGQMVLTAGDDQAWEMDEWLIDELLPVSRNNHIVACRGFDFFALLPA